MASSQILTYSYSFILKKNMLLVAALLESWLYMKIKSLTEIFADLYFTNFDPAADCLL